MLRVDVLCTGKFSRLDVPLPAKEADGKEYETDGEEEEGYKPREESQEHVLEDQVNSTTRG